MDALWSADLLARVEDAARFAGFDLTGVAAASLVSDRETAQTAERFEAWIELGHAGEMAYLARRNEQGELLRSSVRRAFPWARSVLVCALNYNVEQPRSTDPAAADAGWIARYAWSADEQGRPLDYHVDLLRRLREVESALRQALPCETRCFVDTGPILERDVAARAGIGWIGKNTCVLNQQLGSWLLLGVIVTSLELGENTATLPAADRCGSCTRCIDACPTNALVAPRQMDASRCISYLTIEHKGAIAEPLRAAMGRQVFGCDICQDVCPWNRKAPIGPAAAEHARAELVNPSLAWLGSLDEASFREHFKGSPLERTKLRRVRRNVAIAMGNSGLEEFRPRLAEWAAGADPLLQESAEWALSRLAGASASIGMAAESGSGAPPARVRPDEHGLGDDR